LQDLVAVAAAQTSDAEAAKNKLLEQLVTYRAGGPTAAATPTPAPSDHLAPNIIGSVNGKPFILGSDAVVALSANGTGSFSGTDVNGYGSVKGTFDCDR